MSKQSQAQPTSAESFEKQAVISSDRTPVVESATTSPAVKKAKAGKSLDELADDPTTRLDAAAERLLGQ